MAELGEVSALPPGLKGLASEKSVGQVQLSIPSFLREALTP